MSTPTVQTICDNEWLSLRITRNPEAGVNGYVYSHESSCAGRKVAVLPYRRTDHGMEYLVKSEVTPCWSYEHMLSAITGGYEGGDIVDDAVHELLEETGYAITPGELIALGEAFGTKSTDTVYSLFAVNLTAREPGEAIGDGSRLEAESRATWVGKDKLIAIKDPQVALMYLRLQDHLADQFFAASSALGD